MSETNLDINENSKYRVAYQLMDKIDTAENGNNAPKNPREYYLRLYRQCIKTAYRLGDSMEDILKEVETTRKSVGSSSSQGYY